MTVAETPDVRPVPRLPVSVRRYLRAFRTPKGVVALALLTILVGAAFLAPVLFPDGYDVQSSDALAPATPAQAFGTDEVGRDIFVRTIYALRASLSLVLIVVPASMVVGTLLGLLGAITPALGSAVQRVMDIILGFPGMVLGVCIALIMGPGWRALFIAILIFGLPGFARISRATLLEQQQREYVVAARTLGVSRWTVLVRHILPNALDPIIVRGAIFIVHAIFIEAGLSIVGIGLQPPQPSLGQMLNAGMLYVTGSPMYMVGPLLVLFLVALAFSLLADALNRTVIRP